VNKIRRKQRKNKNAPTSWKEKRGPQASLPFFFVLKQKEGEGLRGLYILRSLAL